MPSLIKIEKSYDELLEELLEDHKKLEKINKRIEKFEILEKVTIKEIGSEIFDKTKLLEEIKTKLRKVKTTIMKKGFGMKLISKKQ